MATTGRALTTSAIAASAASQTSGSEELRAAAKR